MAEVKDDPRVMRMHDEVIERVKSEGFMNCTFSGRRRGERPEYSRATLRPVSIRDKRTWQMECRDATQSITHNIENSALIPSIRRLLSSGYSDINLMSADGDLHVKFSKKGRMMISRSKPMQRDVDDARPHNRIKKRPLDGAGADSFLRVAGILDEDGKIKPSMQSKFRQVNEFLRILNTAVEEGEGPLTVVDCGCGRAILLFSAYYYIRNVLNREVRIIGIDRDEKVINTCRQWAVSLDLIGVTTFHAKSINDVVLDDVPDVVMSLHACDTATDDALARAVKWKARSVLCSPCCQHELQKDLKDAGALRGMLRHGILRERLADILTDTFRSQLLRIMGYRVRVMEFIDSDATARNIMLRAERGVRMGSGDAITEYLELKDFWKVEPALEGLLGKEISRMLESFNG